MSEGQDDFDRGFRDIPSDAELRAMTDVTLDIAIQESAPGSAVRATLDRERLRRSAEEAHQQLKRHDGHNGRQSWHQTGAGQIAIAVIGTVLATCLTSTTVLLERSSV